MKNAEELEPPCALGRGPFLSSPSCTPSEEDCVSWLTPVLQSRLTHEPSRFPSASVDTKSAPASAGVGIAAEAPLGRLPRPQTSRVIPAPPLFVFLPGATWGHREADDLRERADHRRKATDSQWSPEGRGSSRSSTKAHDGVANCLKLRFMQPGLAPGPAARGSLVEGLGGLLTPRFLPVSLRPASSGRGCSLPVPPFWGSWCRRGGGWRGQEGRGCLYLLVFHFHFD